MNTIDAMKQALGALKIADVFCGGLTADECPDTVHVPIRYAKSALESLAEAGALAVVVSRDENPDAMNRLYGEAYGVDWVYGDTKREEAQTVEPVAIVESWTNSSYSRNYKVNWLKNVPEGTKLFTHPDPLPSGERDAVEGLRTWAGITEREALIARLRVGITHDTRDDIVTGSCYDLERAADDAADMLAADALLEAKAWHRGRDAGIAEVARHNAQQVAVPQGWELVDADKMREIIRDIRQHIQQGHLSEEVVAKQNPSYGTGIYTHLWHQMRKLSTLLAAAPQSPQAERVPMTQPEIRQVQIANTVYSEDPWDNYYAFARGIEAHHHIGVKL